MYETNTKTIAQNVFEQRCTDYYNFLFRFALRKTGDKDQAEDIAQTTLMRFLGLMKKTKWDVEVTSVKAYLRKTATNVCNDIWRERGKERTVSYDDENAREELEREAARTDETVVNMDNRIHYDQLYQNIPLKIILRGFDDYEKTVFVLRRVDDVPLKEIAIKFNRNICQVRYDLQKIEATIRYRVRKLTEGKNGNRPH